MSEEGMKETPDIMFALQDPSCHFKSLNNSCALSFSMLLFIPMMIVLRIDSLGTVVATKILKLFFLRYFIEFGSDLNRR